MAVSCTNQRLFRCVSIASLPAKHHIAEIPEVKSGAHAYVLHRFIRYLCIYEVRVSPVLNGSSVIQCFEHSDAIEIHDGISFDFYIGLPHL